MPTNFQYKGKHVKQRFGIDSLTPRGPARWFRAADNAMHKPSSVAGKIFWGRAAMAHRLVTEYEPTTKPPFAHIRLDYNYNRLTGRSTVTPKISYYTCSLFCCAMVVQLDAGMTTYQRLEDYLTENEHAPLSNTPPLRGARCQFCSSNIEAV